MARKPTPVESLPPSDACISEINLSPHNDLAHLQQIQYGIYYAMINLVGAFKEITDPSSHRYTRSQDGSATVVSWWSSSAFSHLIGSATSLESLFLEQNQCYSRILEPFGTDAVAPFLRSTPTTTWGDMVNCANLIRRHGYPEFSLPPQLHAVRLIVGRLIGHHPSSLPERISQMLPRDNNLEHFGDHLALLEAACDQLGSGHSISSSAAYVLSERMEGHIKSLILSPPQNSYWSELKAAING